MTELHNFRRGLLGCDIAGILSQSYTALRLRRPQYEYSPTWKPHYLADFVYLIIFVFTYRHVSLMTLKSIVALFLAVSRPMPLCHRLQADRQTDRHTGSW